MGVVVVVVVNVWYGLVCDFRIEIEMEIGIHPA